MISREEIPPFINELMINNAKVLVHENTILVTKWNWDYQDCLLFQKQAQDYIRVNRKNKIYIFTNHPHVFTLGRGNERGQDELVAFDPMSSQHLAFPLYNIHRGGGITFHYPGQWIFYPICAINENYTLTMHTNWLLQSVKEVLVDNYKIPNVLAANKLVGIWKDRLKIASVGVGVQRFVTEHGLAFNVEHDELMFAAVKNINPCGMSATNYTSLEKSLPDQRILVEAFHQSYLKYHFGLNFPL